MARNASSEGVAFLTTCILTHQAQASAALLLQLAVNFQSNNENFKNLYIYT